MDRPTPARRRPGARALLILPLLLATAACSRGGVSLGWDGKATGPAPVVAQGPVQLARPGDALGLFAARAAEGQQETVLLSDSGRTASVRLARVYQSAAGRECKELLVGGGTESRNVLYCQDPQLGWVPARPLLRGGAVGRT
ncbi:DVU3141 family protein [Roseomonas elaeocarpi]|uniref:DVU3141 family protein n=1 Tax=Roseomonas elaeocarpi TaxID=907779 RepID=A0ABV6JY45_9PROT